MIRHRNPIDLQVLLTAAALVSPIIRVGEVPGSNPGAPIYLWWFAGILSGGERGPVGVMDRRYWAGALGSPFDFFEVRSSCTLAVSGKRSVVGRHNKDRLLMRRILGVWTAQRRRRCMTQGGTVVLSFPGQAATRGVKIALRT